jgi:hypothetical protein
MKVILKAATTVRLADVKPGEWFRHIETKLKCMKLTQPYDNELRYVTEGGELVYTREVDKEVVLETPRPPVRKMCSFDKLKPGDVFSHDNFVYIRANCPGVGVSLETGSSPYFMNNHTVELISGAFVEGAGE